MEKRCLYSQMGIEVPLAPKPGALRDTVFGNDVVSYATQDE